MKILIFCTTGMNHASGSGIRARLITEGLLKKQVNVFVVSSSVPKEFKKNQIDSLLLNDQETWPETLEKAVNFFKPDLIYGITEGGADAVAKIGHKYKLKIAFDLHGLGPVEILELGHGYGSRWWRICKSLYWLHHVFQADMITVANPTLYPIIKFFKKSTFGLFGLTDINKLNPVGPKRALGRDKNRLQVLYAGNFYTWQGIDLFLKAIKLVLAESSLFEFTLIGSIGLDKNHCQALKKKFPRSVKFVESVPFSRIADYYRGADILVIPRPWMLSTYLAFPQKLVDYMASGRLIIATDIKPHCWALTHPMAGILCKPTAEGIASAILSVKKGVLISQLAKAARYRARKNFSHLRQAGVIKQLLKETLKK